MSRIPASTVSSIAAAETATRFFTRRHPGYKVLGYQPGRAVFCDGYEVVFALCTLSRGEAFAETPMTREDAEKWAVAYLARNADKVPETARMRFDHVDIHVVSDDKAVVRNHVNCFDEK